jgi:SAM-dependent methyltransferase
VPLAGLKNTAAAVMRRIRRTPPHDVLNRRLIARHVPGRSFVDVGTMWKVHGGYAFHALESGATSVAGVDLMPASEEFLARNAAHGGAVRFLQADVNDASVPRVIGQVDVVFCSGVLYHVPDPVWTLQQLKRMCRSTLILGSSTIPEQNRPQVAVFLPFLDAASRRALSYRGPGVKIGLDTPYDPTGSYANFFWGFSPSCIDAMLRTAGFDVLETHPYRYAVTFVCRPGPSPP